MDICTRGLVSTVYQLCNKTYNHSTKHMLYNHNFDVVTNLMVHQWCDNQDIWDCNYDLKMKHNPFSLLWCDNQDIGDCNHNCECQNKTLSKEEGYLVYMYVYLMNIEHDLSVKRMKFPSTYDVSYFTKKTQWIGEQEEQMSSNRNSTNAKRKYPSKSRSCHLCNKLSNIPPKRGAP